jgi:hypothetical protein
MAVADHQELPPSLERRHPSQISPSLQQPVVRVSFRHPILVRRALCRQLMLESAAPLHLVRRQARDSRATATAQRAVTSAEARVVPHDQASWAASVVGPGQCR